MDGLNDLKQKSTETDVNMQKSKENCSIILFGV